MRKRILALAAVLVMLASCTEGGHGALGPTSSPTREPWHGGTLRLVTDPVRARAEDWDPSGYFFGPHMELYRCCLTRTLYSYEGRPALEGGSVLLPDLADGFPEVSADGLTWTIHMREGLRFGPPFEGTEITATDIVRGLEREARVYPGGYDSWFMPIEGYAEAVEGAADTISGLEVPDDHTLVVRLTEPASDLAYRFGMPPTAPIPPGADEGHDEDYFRFLVSSGPYMLEGSEDLDFTVPAEQQVPVAGFVPGASVTLVRNPSWDPATDPLRPAFVDRIRITIPKRYVDARLAEQVDVGRLDVLMLDATSPLRERFEIGGLDGRVVPSAVNATVEISLNLAVPPFDDVHVRRAVNLVLDRAAVAEARRNAYVVHWNGAPTGVLEGLIPTSWQPSWATGVGEHGSVAAARQEMALSAYDVDADGLCDDRSCSAVPATTYRGPGVWTAPVVEVGLEKIGIRLDLTRYPDPYAMLEVVGRPASRVGMPFGWSFWADFPNGSSWFGQLIGRTITDSGNLNLSLVGASPQQLRSWGYEVTHVPSVDERVERCLALPGQEQADCWAELDRYLSEEVVPSVPVYEMVVLRAVSSRVAEYDFDQVVGWPAFDRIALVPGSE